MGFQDLRDYLATVHKLGMLRVIEEAHWDLEIGAISQMMQETEENPILLFDKIPGYPAGFRVLANHQNNPEKQALVLGLPTDMSYLEIVRQMKEKRKQTTCRRPTSPRVK
ncbi:MAG: UbiD family decarboxylase [Deltaproteobacteria bacterium]|nr:UbiD family decarboxylase [Deltaproteobacteria bacterium]